MQATQLGDRVQVHYVKRYSDGTVRSSRERGDAPLEITVGVSHRRLPGVGAELAGVVPGKTVTLTVPAEKAYGLADPARVCRVSRARFGADDALVAGRRAQMKRTRGRARFVRVVEVRGREVVVDTNHRRCGQAIEVDVELISIRAPLLVTSARDSLEVLVPDTMPGPAPTGPDLDRLLAYVADLELEVDRLRRQSRFIEQTAAETLMRILRLCTGASPGDPLPTLAEVGVAARGLVEVVKDLHDSPGYHPAHDQVVAIAVRPLAAQVFRWQQRLTGAPAAVLRLDLDPDHVEWFPARLRHILDNLFAHALRARNPAADQPWVALGLRAIDAGYQLRVTDNGLAAPPGEDRRVLDLFSPATQARAAGLGAGLAVVRLLVEQSGGKLTAHPGREGGTEVVFTLPRYDLLDYLE